MRNVENLSKAIFDGAGVYGIPPLKPTRYKPSEFVPFNYAASSTNRAAKSVHFYLDDYQFTRLWTNIDKYVPMLSEFKQVLSPDFSTFTDFPLAMQIYNHYRKHWVGAYLQSKGVDVIPTISWSDAASYAWCFDGEPVGGCVSVSSVGCLSAKESKDLFLAGYQEMLVRLNPAEILFYGKVPSQCEGNIIEIKPFYERFKEVNSNGRQR